ncbi:hypothetical protein F4776DRAFT_671016 [Hypoxylon sp. NC0597]|nr:hypothetical protein F4776DRAFT_671016 [Hypoxylon sp. NC0597]
MRFHTFIMLLVVALSMFLARELSKISIRSEAGLNTTAEPHDPDMTPIVNLSNYFSLKREMGNYTREFLTDIFHRNFTQPRDTVTNPLGSAADETTSAPPRADPTSVDPPAHTSEFNIRVDPGLNFKLDLYLQIADYNERNPGHRIPTFAWCYSTRSEPRLYTRDEIFLAMREGVHAFDPADRPDDSTLEASWPRPLGLRQAPMDPHNTMGPTGRLFQYPVGIGDLDSRADPVRDDVDNEEDDDHRIVEEPVDRVTFNRDGLYTGVLRYHDDDDWHYCLPEDWRNKIPFHRRHSGYDSLRVLVKTIERWVEDFRDRREAEN